MSAASRSGAWLRAAAAISAVVLSGSCGSDVAPAEAVPQLHARLSAVDQAIADHRYGQARRQIQRLVRVTVSAREAGELDADAAEPILAAAASLVSALPRQENAPEPASPQPQPEPDADEQAPDEGAGNDAEQREELQQEREEHEHGQEGDGENGDGEDGDGEDGDSGSSGSGSSGHGG